MTACITRNKYRIAAFVLVFGLWWGMSRIYSPLVVPPIGLVIREISRILVSAELRLEILRTVCRLAAGLLIGVGLGIFTGLLGGLWRPFRESWKPVLGIIQVIPPISWLILAIIWFGYNGRASIFIVVMSVVPSIYICIADGIAAIDLKLVEMGKVFCFPPARQLRYILIPSVLPYFFSGLKIAVGMACKTVVMGEVLTTTTGIGGQIMTARLNIEPETVIAWTVVIVGIYYASVWAGRLCLFARRRFREHAGR